MGAPPNKSGYESAADLVAAIRARPDGGRFDDDPEVQQPVAATVAVDQCRRLTAGGVEACHLYTMNKRQLPAAICRSLGLRPTPAPADTAS